MITFNSITADSVNAIINTLPLPRSADRRIKLQELENVDGALLEDYGAYPLVLPIKITCKTLAQIDGILAWLQGSGRLIRNDTPSKYWNAQVVQGVQFQQNKSTFEATAEFLIIDPYRYATIENDTTIVASPSAVTNAGTVQALPLVKITGSGTITITINGSTLNYTFGAESAVYIDCKSKDCYTNPADINGTLRNPYLSGVYPVLSPGSNVVSFTGIVTQVLITPRSRWL